MRKRLIALTTVLSFGVSTAAQSAPSQLKEIHRYTLGGTGGWDLMAVDAKARHLFIARSDRLMIVNSDSGKLLAEIGGLNRAHGVALVPNRDRGYVSSGGDNRLVVFDLKSLKTIQDITVTGKNPDAVLFDASTDHVFAFNGGSNSADVIDAASGKILTTISLPGKPELAVTDNHGKVFVNLEDKNAIGLIDAKTNEVITTWPLGSCDEPSGLAIDMKHRRLFSVCANKQMAILSADDGRIVATAPIGDGPDGATFDAASGNAFSSNSDGTLTVVHENDPNHFSVVANVPTPPRSRTITLDEKTHRVILATAEFDAAAKPTADQPRPRPTVKAGSFGIIIVGQ